MKLRCRYAHAKNGFLCQTHTVLVHETAVLLSTSRLAFAHRVSVKFIYEMSFHSQFLIDGMNVCVCVVPNLKSTREKTLFCVNVAGTQCVWIQKMNLFL